jgi:ferredoxin-NADP reductase
VMSAPAPARVVRVRSMAWEAADVLSLTLADPDGNSLPAWEPGAHIDLSPEDGLTAQYSLCGAPGGAQWRLGVLLQPDGKGVSRCIHERLRPGALVRVSEPRNNFPLVEAQSYLFIAGGIGITPFVPMIDRVVSSGKPWQLAYGGRKRDSMAFVESLRSLGPGVRLYPEEEVGRLPLDALLDAASPGRAVYCCGPEPLIAAVEHWLSAHGRPAPHVERFSAKPRDDSNTKPFRVLLAKRNQWLDIPADKSIADVLDAHEVFVPTSCREGTCGSCETRVLCGRIEHRDSLLTAEERGRQDTMMVCVSRAAADALTLDL